MIAFKFIPRASTTQVAASKRKRVATTIEVNGFTVLRSNNYTMADGISTISGARTGIAASRRRKRQVLFVIKMVGQKNGILARHNEI